MNPIYLVILIPIHNKRKEIISNAIIDIKDYDIVRDYKFHFDHVGNPVTYINSKHIKLCNLLLNFNTDSKFVIDHVNRNLLDNRRCNLRIVSYSNRMVNRRFNPSNSNTGYVGVKYLNDQDRNKKYVAYINKNRVKYMKYCYTLAEAVEWRKHKELELYGFNR